MSSTKALPKKQKFDLENRGGFEERLVKHKIAVSEEKNSTYIPYENVEGFVNLMKEIYRSGNEQTKANVMLRIKDAIEMMPAIPEEQGRRIIKLSQNGVQNPYWQVQEYSIWVAEKLLGRFEGRRNHQDTKEIVLVFKQGARKDNDHVVRGSAIKGVLDSLAFSSALTKDVIPNAMELIKEWIEKPKNFGYGGLSKEAQDNNRAAGKKLTKK